MNPNQLRTNWRCCSTIGDKRRTTSFRPISLGRGFRPDTPKHTCASMEYNCRVDRQLQPNAESRTTFELRNSCARDEFNGLPWSSMRRDFDPIRLPRMPSPTAYL